MTVASRRRNNTNFDNNLISRLQKQFPDLIPPAIALIIFLVAWQAFSWLPGATLPGPIQVIQDTWMLIMYPFYDRGGIDKGLFWQIWASLQRVAISYTLAAIVGIGVGIAIGVNKTIYKALDPLFQLLRTVPPLAWVPISLAALRQNEPAALFVIFITAIWPILINTYVGVTQIPQDYNNVAKVLQLNKKDYFFNILIPAALPYIFTGLRIAIGLAWLAIIAAEIVMSGIVGIGFFIWDAYQNNDVSEVILALVYIGIVGLLLDKLMAWIQTLIVPAEQK
ncbi:nitrate ABC transporter permease [Fischerella thermalis]|jgi:bicarbonate transport system permease protein|uniref:Nitrate ABC transporter, inner membrane subunit n=1 Tax=Fischerella thermalis JSC-11 TaxID=741277 RepID=G6FYB8_9CYAN|nr:nitrate ABC transporter permease [Fischerella thermalis]PMB10842.1 nitrate ABC transporter, permease protein [Fischerella thermalis CCMEE 5328]PMB11069.1 nitrate ABC transporter, permease protein [Fischerella thermalis CCMEE 5273]EHC09695.1 nitrate ABC transporter, inner membrane subunit [Fischerella thermalis JSC-11]PLZ10201.1 nitrate ABC transporter, permease protein [Fischerella thermalis WC1110]PLZ10529.1 nitrate ABC transporter, permease protein [Fischerella thermalis WC114]